jgi:hypothetical protein
MSRRKITKPKKGVSKPSLKRPPWWDFVEKITPAQARSWLENHNYADNRPINKAKVNYLTRQIKGKLWVVNGDPIRFDPQGRLIDGQHRLAAIVTAGVSIQSVVFRGVETSTFTTIDRGWVRSNAQMLAMMDYKYTRTLASAARLLWLYEDPKTNLDTRTVEVSPDELELILEVHPGLIEAAAKVHHHKVTHVVPGGIAAMSAYFFFQSNDRKAETFFGRLGDGAELHKNSPMYVLREKLMTAKMQRRRWKNSELLSMLVRAWNAHYSNRKIKVLRQTTKGGDKSVIIKTPPIKGLE